MNYEFIKAVAGPLAAAKIRSDKVYDYLGDDQPVDAESLDEVIRGAVILGAEPVDYPFTDGLFIYVRQPGGRVLTLYIEGVQDTDGEYPGLTISKSIIV